MRSQDDKTYLYDSHPILASALVGTALGATVGGLTWLIASLDWFVALALAVPLGVLASIECYFEMSDTGEPSRGNPRWLGRLHFIVILAYLSTLVIRVPEYRLAGLVVAVAAAVTSIGYTIYDLRRRHFRSLRSPESLDKTE